MKLIIGLTGYPLCGKGVAGGTIETLLKKDGYSVSRHRFSDILRDTLDIWGVPHGRDNEQRLAQLMDRLEKGTLSHAIKNRLAKDRADVGILDGVRWFSDEAMLRTFNQDGVKSIIVYVVAEESVRYERMLKRNRAGEAATGLEEFKRQGSAENESFIPEIGKRADVTLTNNYKKMEDLEKDIETAYRSSIRPLLDA